MAIAGINVLLVEFKDVQAISSIYRSAVPDVLVSRTLTYTLVNAKAPKSTLNKAYDVPGVHVPREVQVVPFVDVSMVNCGPPVDVPLRL